MRVQVIGTEQECQLALDALDLILDVQETSPPRAVGGGLVQVDAVVVDPTADPPSDEEVAATLGIPLSEVLRMSAGLPYGDVAEGPGAP